MAATAKNIVRGDMGAFYVTVDDVTFDTSYPLGGYSLAGIIPLQTILGCDPMGGTTAGSGYSPFWNTGTSKLQLLTGASVTPTATPTVTVIGSQAASGAPLQITPTSGNAGVLGTTGAIGTQIIPAATFGITLNLGATGQTALAEVTAGTNVATIVARMMSIGY